MHSDRHGSAHTSVTGWYPRPLKQLALKLVWAAGLCVVLLAGMASGIHAIAGDPLPPVSVNINLVVRLTPEEQTNHCCRT
jgi:hypothetical protein